MATTTETTTTTVITEPSGTSEIVATPEAGTVAAAPEPAPVTPEQTTWEQVPTSTDRLGDRLDEIVRDQRARRIVVRDGDGRIVADFPLAVGVVGALLAARVAAIAAIVALLNDCTIEVEHELPAAPSSAAS